MRAKPEVIQTELWEETAESDNPFAAAACYCSGYDVYGDLLGKASWVEYLYLLLRRERPSPQRARLLEGLAIVLANPGPRDHSVRAAMNGGVGGSTNAACLIAALGVGAGQLGGAHEVALAMDVWQECTESLSAWKTRLSRTAADEPMDIWPAQQHPPGFDPHGTSCALPVRQTLDYLASCVPGGALGWLQAHQKALEDAAQCPLAMTGVASAAMVDLGLDAQQGEMLCLILRLPGAAVHALEQKALGWRHYPFFATGLELEP